MCEPGWGSDLTIFKTRNCWLPSPAIDVIDGTIGSLCFVVFLFILKETFQARSYARTFLIMTALSMLCASGYLLSHHLEGGTHGPATVVMFNLAIRFASDGMALASYQMLKSFWRMGGKGKSFKTYVIIFQLTEFVLLFAASAAMIALNGDDYAFSIAMTVFLLVFALHFAGLLLFIIVSTKRVIRTVEGAPMGPKASNLGVDSSGKKENWESPGLAAIEENKHVSFSRSRLSLGTNWLAKNSSTSSPSSVDLTARRASGIGGADRRTSQTDSAAGGSQRFLDKRSQALVNKVRRYRRYGKLAGPLVVIAMFIICCLEWILGSVPLMWVVFGISVSHFPVVGFAQTLLAKSNSPEKDSPAGLGTSTQMLLTSNPPRTPRSNSIVL